MNIIAVAIVIGALLLIVLAANAIAWLIIASHRADERERAEAWSDVLMSLQGGWSGEDEDA